jgi:AcrR family transcriptional regulator
MTDANVPDGREARSVYNRQELIDAGLRLIERDGNWRATVRDITTEANISRRTFFNHFTNVEYFRLVLLKDHQPLLLQCAARLDTPEKILREVMR